jgi:Tfp pilus assembly major pilin PilA
MSLPARRFEKLITSDGQNGTMLVNLLVALSIVAILTTITIPYIKKYQPNLKLHATARDLTSDIRYTQQLTVTEQKVHLVAFDLAHDSYTILRIDAATTTVKSVSLDPDINFKEVTDLTDDQIVFNFYGGVSQAGRVVLTNINDITAVINIKPSGYVQLEE